MELGESSPAVERSFSDRAKKKRKNRKFSSFHEMVGCAGVVVAD